MIVTDLGCSGSEFRGWVRPAGMRKLTHRIDRRQTHRRATIGSTGGNATLLTQREPDPVVFRRASTSRLQSRVEAVIGLLRRSTECAVCRPPNEDPVNARPSLGPLSTRILRPFPLRTSEPKPGGRASDNSLLDVPVAAGVGSCHLIFYLARPQRQGQCHRLRDVCGRADIHVCEDQNSQIPGIAGWASLTVWTGEPSEHPAGWGLCLALSQMSSTVPIATTSASTRGSNNAASSMD